MSEHRGLVRGILELVLASGGQIESRIRLQKLVYLLRKAGNQDFGKAQFSYHYYGPYSREVSEVLQDAVAAGLLVEHRLTYDGGEKVRYSYELSGTGREWLDEHSGGEGEELSDFMERLRSPHWRTLELAATATFLRDKKVSADWSGAFSDALRLKPECREFREEAEKVVRDLEL